MTRAAFIDPMGYLTVAKPTEAPSSKVEHERQRRAEPTTLAES
jgi:hypothetical protein